MRGIRFLVNNEYSDYLSKILECTDIIKYTWYIDQDEILFFDDNKGAVSNDFFDKSVLTGKELNEYIKRKNYCVISANIKAYPSDELKNDIKTYDDFKRSKCEIILLFCDVIYVDFYCKNNEIIKKVYEVCKRNKFKDVEYITDENDCRTRLSV